MMYDDIPTMNSPFKTGLVRGPDPNRPGRAGEREDLGRLLSIDRTSARSLDWEINLASADRTHSTRRKRCREMSDWAPYAWTDDVYNGPDVIILKMAKRNAYKFWLSSAGNGGEIFG